MGKQESMVVGHTGQRGYNKSLRNTATHLSRLQGKKPTSKFKRNIMNIVTKGSKV